MGGVLSEVVLEDGVLIDRKTADLVDLRQFPVAGHRTLFFPETNSHLKVTSYKAPLNVADIP